MKMNHVGLWVRDLEKMKFFYETYFNGKAGEKYINENKGFSSYFLRFDDDTRLELMTKICLREARPWGEEPGPGFAHIAFSSGSAEAVRLLTDRLTRDGVALVSAPRVTGDGYYESVIADPEGNHVEITI